MNRWEHVYEFSGPGHLEVDQRAGALRVVGWEKSAVQVKATWAGEGSIEDRLEVDAQPNLLSLAVKSYRTGFLGLVTDDQLDLEIFVPRGTICNLESGSGPVTVESTRSHVMIDAGSGRVVVSDVTELNVDAGSGSVQVFQVAGPVSVDAGSGRIELETALGPVALEAGSGSISTRRIGQGLRAETASGSVTVAEVEGGCYLETSSGSIQVSRIVSPEMHMETGSGSIRAEALDVKGLFVESGSGGVDVELVRIHPDGEYQIETGSGRVGVAVPATAGFNLEIESNGGVDFGGLPVQILRREDSEISAVVGAGGPGLSIETGSGSITFRTHQAPAPSQTEVATTRLTDLVKDDPALEKSDQMARILKMVQEGKLTVQEAEQLLGALDGEEG